MARSIARQTVQAASIISARGVSSAVKNNSGGSNGSNGRSVSQNIVNVNKKVISVLKETVADADHSGDVRAQDILDTSRIGVTNPSGNGFITLDGITEQYKDSSRVIKLTIGKYDGTHWGVAVGSSTSAPDIVLGTDIGGVDGMTFYQQKFITMKKASRIIFYDSSNANFTQVGYVTSQFQISSDTADGIVLTGNTCVTKSFNPSYGGGSGVLFIGNAQSNPSTNPSNGGILYVNAGALTYRGSGGTVTVIAPA